MATEKRRWHGRTLIVSLGVIGSMAATYALAEDTRPLNEVALAHESIFGRAMGGGAVVFSVLMILVLMSICSWGIVAAKWLYLRRIDDLIKIFVKSFWESRSLNDLNSRLNEFPYSPAREVFRTGYAELVRASQLREQVNNPEMALTVAVDNLNRSLAKAKITERNTLEKYLSFLAIGASTAPFIGLFGTVWGIMNSFEGIAKTGSASLAAVAPGISEALIATAFGLAAAIPAAVGFNIFNTKIRTQIVSLDGFCADFMNIVERYLVSDQKRSGAAPSGPSV
jgi:biopolymer transport protein TolQ